MKQLRDEVIRPTVYMKVNQNFNSVTKLRKISNLGSTNVFPADGPTTKMASKDQMTRAQQCNDKEDEASP